MLNHYLELSDGEKRKLNDFVKEVPLQAYMSLLHIDICDEIARLKQFSNREHKVYTNLLVPHSDYCRSLTAALTLVRSGFISATSITTALPPNFVSKVIGEKQCRITQNYPPSTQFLQRKMRFRLIVKTLVHKIYRLWPSKPRQARQAIRTWVEISELMFQEEFSDSAILIYPFYLNIRRHLKFIRRCLNKYDNVSLVGLPYEFGNAIRAVFFGRDVDIVNAEVAAYTAHADEICSFASETLASSDEFEAGAICLGEELREKGRQVKNKAHGIAYVCPYVGYDQFQVYNSAQELYFGYKSPKTKFVVIPRSNSARSEICKKPAAFRPCVVILHGNYMVSGLSYEKSMEETVCRILTNFSEESGVFTAIKMHPNTPKQELNSYRRDYRLPIVRSLGELPECMPIFVALLTAAFYDFYEEGPFLFVDEGIVPVQTMYGIDVISTPAKSLEAKIGELCKFDQWKDAHLNQIRLMTS